MSKTMLIPYLAFNGDARAAMEFYHQLLGGDLDMQTFAESHQETSERYKDKLIHAKLEADEMTLMASDGMEGRELVFGDNVSLSLSGSDKAKLTEVFNGLAEGGKVTMPLEEQFWGDTFGMVDDKFGVHWMVNITKE